MRSMADWQVKGIPSCNPWSGGPRMTGIRLFKQQRTWVKSSCNVGVSKNRAHLVDGPSRIEDSRKFTVFTNLVATLSKNIHKHATYKIKFRYISWCHFHQNSRSSLRVIDVIDKFGSSMKAVALGKKSPRPAQIWQSCSHATVANGSNPCFFFAVGFSDGFPDENTSEKESQIKNQAVDVWCR